jgi:hypothetical protein
VEPPTRLVRKLLVAAASSWNEYKAGGSGSEECVATREARLEDATKDVEDDEMVWRWALPDAAPAPKGPPEVDVKGEEVDTLASAPATAGRRLAEEEERWEEGTRCCCCEGNASELDLDHLLVRHHKNFT